MSDFLDGLSNGNPRALATLAVAMTAVAAGALYFLRSSSSSEAATAEPLPEEVTEKIMCELQEKVRKIAQALSKKEEELRRNNARVAQTNPNFDTELKQFLVDEIHKQVELEENQIYAKYNVVQAQVAASCAAFQSNQKVYQATQEITGIVSIGAEPDLTNFTLEKTMNVMEDIMEGMNLALEECCAAVKKIHPDISAQNAQKAISELYMQRFPKVNADVHEKHSCDKATIEAALVKYQSDPKFNQRMQQLSAIQKQRMEACGVQLR